MTFFTEMKKINPKLYMEAQKTLNSQSNPEQESNVEYKLDYRPRKNNSKILAQKQTCRPM
jgi:hypothetical protein